MIRKRLLKEWLIVAVGILTITPLIHSWTSPGPLAVTEDGVFRGVSTASMNEFLGIRYGQAPVGGLRWRRPLAALRNHGIQEATQFGNHCPQPPSPFGLPSTTEDCLFLNVFTPLRHTGDSDDGHDHFGRRPVMLWIHGGALASW